MLRDGLVRIEAQFRRLGSVVAEDRVKDDPSAGAQPFGVQGGQAAAANRGRLAAPAWPRPCRRRFSFQRPDARGEKGRTRRSANRRPGRRPRSRFPRARFSRSTSLAASLPFGSWPIASTALSTAHETPTPAMIPVPMTVRENGSLVPRCRGQELIGQHHTGGDVAPIWLTTSLTTVMPKSAATSAMMSLDRGVHLGEQGVGQPGCRNPRHPEIRVGKIGLQIVHEQPVLDGPESFDTYEVAAFSIAVS